MLDAVLIAGNALRFLHDMKTAEKHLLEGAGFARRSVRLLHATNMDTGHVETVLNGAAYRQTDAPLLIAYSGHADETGWWFDDERVLRYMDLGEAIVHARRPVLVINDCCRAEALCDELARQGASLRRVGLLVACGREATTSGGLLQRTISRWATRRDSLEMEICRGATTTFEKAFFAKKAASCRQAPGP